MIYQDENLCIIKIPEFKTKFEISHSRRAKYYKRGDKIPKKYSDLDFYAYDKDEFLIERYTYKKIIKNTRVAGTPKYWVLNGQDLYSGNMHHLVRSKISTLVHEYLASFIGKASPIKLEKGEYLDIKCFMSELVGANNWDCDNKWPWTKWFQDTMVETGIIPDDSVGYIRSAGQIYFNEVSDIKDRSLIFVVEKFKSGKNEDIIEQLYGIKKTIRDQK